MVKSKKADLDFFGLRQSDEQSVLIGVRYVNRIIDESPTGAMPPTSRAMTI